jgi:hypothetical protein
MADGKILDKGHRMVSAPGKVEEKIPERNYEEITSEKRKEKSEKAKKNESKKKRSG